MPSMMPSWNMDIAISAPVLPARDRDLGLAVLHRFDGAPHAGVAAAAQHMAGLVFHRARGRRHGERSTRCLRAWRWRASSGFSMRLVAVQHETHVGMALQRSRSSAATTMPGPASPPMASIETVRSRATLASQPSRTRQRRRRSGSSPSRLRGRHNGRRRRRHDADAWCSPQLGQSAWAGAVRRMMRAAHVAARRRGFSFWDRHGGETPSKVPNRNGGAGKAGGVGSRESQARDSSQKPGNSRA